MVSQIREVPKGGAILDLPPQVQVLSPLLQRPFFSSPQHALTFSVHGDD